MLPSAVWDRMITDIKKIQFLRINYCQDWERIRLKLHI